MADQREIVYKRTDTERDFTYDFADEVPSGDSVKAVGAGDTDVTALDSAGVDQTATVIGTISLNGSKLTARLKAGVEFEEYLVTYVAEMTNSGERFAKLLDLRIRDNVIG